VVHDYGDRAQNTLYAQLLLEVEIQGRDGERLLGRHMLQLMNRAYQNFAQKGVVVLMQALDPRFPELRSDGVVAQGVRLFHARAEPVTIASITRSLHVIGGGAEPTSEPVEVRSLIPGGTIPSGHGIEFQVTLDARARPDVFSIDYRLEGETVEGFPVRGGFSVMRPPEPPTRDKHRPVDDPVLVSKIQAARRILGKEWVTDQDIWQLEREGRLASRPFAQARAVRPQASDRSAAGEQANGERMDSPSPTAPADSKSPVGPSQPPRVGAIAGASGGALAP
jgi:hypothetical protein